MKPQAPTGPSAGPAGEAGPPLRGYHRGLIPIVVDLIADLPPGARILDVGCGHGQLSCRMTARGLRVKAIDPAAPKIERCRQWYPGGDFHVASATDPDFPAFVGPDYDAVVSMEVIEHVFSPYAFLANCRAVLRPGGMLVLTTPYHGYLKNLLLSLAGAWDLHLEPGKEGGHIKFWSRATLTGALARHGFEVVAFRGYGRGPYAWKAMAIKARRTT